jgi:predicted XRE-type DNA-binding protein
MEGSRRPTMTETPTVTAGSGNVFADLGLPDAEAELLKAQLTHQLASRIAALGLTQTSAAVRLGVSQPDVSRLMKMRATGFSTDRLLAMLTSLDLDIDIVLRPAGTVPHASKIRVVTEKA